LHGTEGKNRERARGDGLKALQTRAGVGFRSVKKISTTKEGGRKKVFVKELNTTVPRGGTGASIPVPELQRRG